MALLFPFTEKFYFPRTFPNDNEFSIANKNACTHKAGGLIFSAARPISYGRKVLLESQLDREACHAAQLATRLT